MKIDVQLFDNGRKLPVVEEFYSIQGEGFHVGKPAYFLRIGGCDVGCSWCDTKFSWDPSIHPVVETDKIIENIISCPAKAVVVTGGEPLLFDLDYLCKELKKNNIDTFLETSGSHPLTGEWHWICLSPKKQMPPVESIFLNADEMKVIISEQSDFVWAELNKKKVKTNCELFLQPEWSVYDQMIGPITEYAKNNPEWKISLQAHKFMRIP
jgi:organic radical activating enzyme